MLPRSTKQDACQSKYWFTTTNWNLVLTATDASDSNARTALAQLCTRYWYPLYAFIRRQGFDAVDAEDLTQGYFEHMLRHDRLGQADPARGRFRTFLLATLQNYLNDNRDRARRIKRGGLVNIFSWDAAEAERRFGMEPVDGQTPEVMLNRQWALTTLTRVRQRLREEFQAAGKIQLHDLLHAHVEGEMLPYEEIARRLGTTEAAVKSSAHRIRQRLRDLLWEEVAQTVATQGELELEVRQLITWAAEQGA